MIYLVRHGRTEFNAEGRFQGHCDSALTPLGVAQAHRYGELLVRLIPDPADWTLVASPLGRAVATAGIIASALGLAGDFPRDPRIAEIGMGGWDGLTDYEIEMTSPGARAGSTRYDFFFRARRSPPGRSSPSRTGWPGGFCAASTRTWTPRPP